MYSAAAAFGGAKYIRLESRKISATSVAQNIFVKTKVDTSYFTGQPQKLDFSRGKAEADSLLQGDQCIFGPNWNLAKVSVWFILGLCLQNHQRVMPQTEFSNLNSIRMRQECH